MSHLHDHHQNQYSWVECLQAHADMFEQVHVYSFHFSTVSSSKVNLQSTIIIFLSQIRGRFTYQGHSQRKKWSQDSDSRLYTPPELLTTVLYSALLVFLIFNFIFAAIACTQFILSELAPQVKKSYYGSNSFQ